MILFAFSLLVDVIWFFLIAKGTWGTTEYKRLAPWETGLHHWVTWVTVINFILKVSEMIEVLISDNLILNLMEILTSLI